MKRGIWCVCTLLAVLFAASCAVAVTYQAHALQMPESFKPGVLDISNSGWICGSGFQSNPSGDYLGFWAYAWDPAGTPIHIPMLFGDRVCAEPPRVNEYGTVAFASFSAPGVSHPCTWSLSTGTVYRGTSEHPTCSGGLSINGSEQLAGGSLACPLVWNPDGSVLTLDYLAGGAGPLAINDSGVVLGIMGGKLCKWDAAGHATELTMAAGDGLMGGMAMNNSGYVAAAVEDEDMLGGQPYARAVEWDPTGIRHDLACPVGTESLSEDINNLGQITGTIGHRAVIWNTDGSYVELPNLCDLPYSLPYAINDSGQVVGVCYGNGSNDRIVVWELVPEPASVLGLLCGMTGLHALRLRKKRS